VALTLQPGERILFEGHPSWRAILDFYFKGILLTALVCLAAAGITELLDDVNQSLVAIIAVVGVGLTILIGFIKRVATSYTITSRRLHIKRGIVSRDVQETRLERVQNVNYSQRLLQRMLQIGDVDFDTAAGDDYNFIFSGVADPADVVHVVDQATHGDAGLGDAGPAPAQTAQTQQQAPPPPQQAPPPPEPPAPPAAQG
jgi:membrane protein YdbS with pleckstrin-like domain